MRLVVVFIVPCVAFALAAQASITAQRSNQQRTPAAVATAAIGNEAKVCDAVYAPVIGTSPAVVLASVDASGRRFCNALLRITPTEPPKILQSIDTWQLEKVSSAVVDADGDGTSELIVPTPISDYQGAKCIAVVPQIYVCSAAGCVASRDRFQSYYKRRAQAIDQELKGAPDETAVCLQMQRDWLYKVAGGR